MTTVLRDLIVVLPGIMGSTLRKNGQLVWAPSSGSIIRTIRTFGLCIQELKLPDGIGDEDPDDGVEAVGLMPDFHVLPGLWAVHLGYSALLDRMRTRFHLVDGPLDDPDLCPNFLPIAYDWRLSNRFNGRRLKTLVEPALERWQQQGAEFRDAKIVFICHSMGGLVARWYVDKEGGVECTRKVITLGTPHRGSLKALTSLVNGIEKGFGPLSIDLTDFARSLPSMHQLLPEYACILSSDQLLKTTETSIPALQTSLVEDGMLFHDELDAAWTGSYDLHPIVGFRQPTPTTCRIVNGRVSALNTINGADDGGDATVPRLAATPTALALDSSTIRGVAERHGSLHSHAAVLEEIEFALTGKTEVYRDTSEIELSVATDDVILTGEPLGLTATSVGESNLALRAMVRDETGRVVGSTMLQPSAQGQRGIFAPLAPGGYVIEVGGVGSAEHRVSPVHCPLLVWNGGTSDGV